MPSGSARPYSSRLSERRLAEDRLVAQLEARLGRNLTEAEWHALYAASGQDIGELSLVEAELLVRLGPRNDAAERGRRELEQATAWPMLLRWLVTATVFSGVLLATQLRREPWLPLGLAAALACSLGNSWLRWRERRASLHAVVDNVGRSGIVERLIDGDPELDGIRDHVLPPARWWGDAAYGRRLKGRLALVARNLDWYMRPPAPPFRWGWFLPVQVVSTLVLAVLPSMMIYSSQASPQQCWITVLLLAVVAVPAWGEVSLEEFFTESLRQELGGRVGAHVQPAAQAPGQ